MAASKKDDPFDEATRFDPEQSVRIAQGHEIPARRERVHQVKTTVDLVSPTAPSDMAPLADRERAEADSLNPAWAPLYLDDEILGSRSINLKLAESDLAALHDTPGPSPVTPPVAHQDLPSAAGSRKHQPAPIRVKRSSIPVSGDVRKSSPAMPQQAVRQSSPGMPQQAVRQSSSGMPQQAVRQSSSGMPQQAVRQSSGGMPQQAVPQPRRSSQEGSAPQRFPAPPTSQVMPGKAADPKLIEGSRIGNYEVIRKIGQGGMGVVYEGRHLLLPRRVAIKFLLTNQSHDEEQIRRFLGEAVASAQIGHKGVVDIYDYGYDENKTAYLIMEFVDGQSLQAVMKRSGQLPIPMVLRVVRDIAEVLAAAHQSGIVHRDLKPDNIILSRDEFGKDFVKILDFGVAKFVNDQGMSGQTVAGSILGTPWYMPPEQCQGLREVDFRSDIYALGCVFYQMLCGKVPFAGSLRDVLTAHIHTPATPPTQFNPSVPPVVEALIQRMMAKDPRSRPSSMDEVAHALSGLVEPNQASVNTRVSSDAMPMIGVPAPVAASSGRSWVAPVLAALLACVGTAAAFYFLQS